MSDPIYKLNKTVDVKFIKQTKVGITANIDAKGVSQQKIG